ncbi:MAG TPA: helix-turn-helix transcriptional regulator [Ktedonobacteraceae bacterium]|jgi:DNA-binding Xre family transcriptional regulator|nr:helix-turn-helix transcriptional regulator [Ktedonobacteraceae bacterium]
MIRLRVKEVAEKQGLNKSRLSRRADVDLKTVQRIWDDPTKEISTATLDKLAKALGVQASDLIETIPDD